jgi:hypothetical protein
VIGKHTRMPWCKECRHREFRAVGPVQLRKDGRAMMGRGRKREYAVIRCTECGTSRWSCHPDAINMARAVEKEPDAGTNS